ncbi:MAG TPA: PH domain-containing protein [Chthoniobacterales bacterium]|nr:PH domain-containing protein [Chthoniobacterales bacterium]
MPEESVWRGRSSQWKNFGRYLLAAAMCAVVIVIFVALSRADSPQIRNLSPYVLILLVLPLFTALVRYLQTISKVYELTTERIKITEGVLSKVTDTLELYRVKDLETRQPFLYRFAGIENVQLNTSDTSSPFIFIQAVPRSVGLGDKIRNQVEIIRQQKGVREIDVE